MKRIVLVTVVCVGIFIAYSQYTFYKLALPVIQSIKVQEYPVGYEELVRSIGVQIIETESLLTKHPSSSRLIELPLKTKSNKDPQFIVEGIEVYLLSDSPAFFRIDKMFRESIKLSDKPVSKELFNEVLGITPIDTYMKVLDYRSSKPSVFASPERRFVDISIYALKAGIIKSEEVIFLSDDNWKALLWTPETTNSKAKSVEYYNIDKKTGLSLLFVNRTTENEISENIILNFLNSLIFEKQNQSLVLTAFADAHAAAQL